MLKQFHQIQKKLDKLAPLKLCCHISVILPKNRTVKQFIENFFNVYNDKYETVYVSFDKIQTEEGKTRSAHDLYRITKYYFPKVTYEDIHIALEKMAFEVQIVGENCCSVGEHVYSSIKARPTWNLGDCSLEERGDKFNEPKFHSQFLRIYEEEKFKTKLKTLYKKKRKYIDFD